MTNEDKATGRHAPEAIELDAATKSRIRAEEVERAKVRAELAGTKTPDLKAPAEAPKSFKIQKSDPKSNQQALRGLISLVIIGGIWWWFAQPHGISTTSGQITYTITSSCPVDVTYTVSGMDTQQESKVPSGWTKTVPQSSLLNQLIAQLQCQGGTVTATISKAGETPKSSSSSGDYTIAQVSYP